MILSYSCYHKILIRTNSLILSHKSAAVLYYLTMDTSLPAGILCQVQLLDGAELCYDVDRTCTGQYLLQHIFDHLDLKESIYFGLQYQHESQFKWLETDKNLKKQLANFSKLRRVHFYFRIKYYPPAPGRCEQEYTRYLFYLQLKLDLYSKSVMSKVESR